MAQTSAQKCYICTEKNSVFYCYECQHALCAVCRERHDKVPALSGHTIADINVIDLSNTQSDKARCITHEKEYQFYCVKCCDLICGKCATSSHKGHSFSDISEIVSEKRKAAQTALQILKSRIEVISSVEDTVRGKHLEKIQLDSQEVINDIESTFEELHTFTKSKAAIKKTEVEDNERIEHQSIELFLKNTGLIHDRYDQVFTALQNILCEKHDITFYKFYNAIDKDITFLDDIPKEPMMGCVTPLDKTTLYTEILEYIQLKADTRICKHCISQEKKLVEIVEQKEQLERDVDGITAKLKAESNEVNRLSISITEMQTKYARKQEENKSLSEEINILKESDPTNSKAWNTAVSSSSSSQSKSTNSKAWNTAVSSSSSSQSSGKKMSPSTTSYTTPHGYSMCFHCNNSNPSSAKFCKYCGERNSSARK